MGKLIDRREVLYTLGTSMLTATVGCLESAESTSDHNETRFETSSGACSRPVNPTSDDGGWLFPRGNAANTAHTRNSISSDNTTLSVAWETTLGTETVETLVTSGESVVVRRRDPDGMIDAIDATSGEQRWQQHRNELASSVGVADGTVYASYEFHDETDGVGVSAFDLTSGTMQWHASDMGSTALMVPTGGAMLVVDGDGLVGYNRETRSPCWRYHPRGSNAIVTSVAVSDGNIYAAITTRDSDVPDGGAVVSLNPDDGVQWRVSIDDPATGLTAGHDLIFVRHSGGLLAVEQQAGTTAWRLETDGGPDHGMALADDTLVIGGYYALIAVNPENGDRRWKREYEATDFSPVVADDVVVATGPNWSSEEGSLVVLDGSGEHRWQTSIAGGPKVSPPAISGSRVYVGTADGRVLAFEPD